MAAVAKDPAIRECHFIFSCPLDWAIKKSQKSQIALLNFREPGQPTQEE